jgi:hypothetical protein
VQASLEIVQLLGASGYLTVTTSWFTEQGYIPSSAIIQQVSLQVDFPDIQAMSGVEADT